MSVRLALSTLLLAAAPAALFAQAMPEGFLCCNLRTDGKWITDINYVEPGKRMLPPGTRAMTTAATSRWPVCAALRGGREPANPDQHV